VIHGFLRGFAQILDIENMSRMLQNTIKQFLDGEEEETNAPLPKIHTQLSFTLVGA
jgi:hypothetical protein